jgi:hypothetical protein
MFDEILEMLGLDREGRRGKERRRGGIRGLFSRLGGDDDREDREYREYGRRRRRDYDDDDD